MSEFRDYYDGMVRFVEQLDEDDHDYLVELKVLAELARVLKVPREHRESMSTVFKKRADSLLQSSYREDAVHDTVLACNDVGVAMKEQDVEDIAKAQQKQ